MDYLQTQENLKEDPKRVFPAAESLMMVGVRYKPHPQPGVLQSSLNVASYARGRDYHEWLVQKLENWSKHAKSLYPEAEFFISTDSKPILERDLAQQAGLGWIGKNSCLIHPIEGSFFFIAEVLTNLKVPAPVELEPIPDFCGKCQKCMIACPTEALISPKVLDARKCISYWTIEAKSPAPIEIREKMGDLFFGCDICQDVCPWNKKVFRQKPIPSKEIPSQEKIIEELRFFLTASNREIEKTWGQTPLIRARPRGLRRNALVVAGNLGLKELRPEIKNWEKSLYLGELAKWALSKITVSLPGL